MEETGAAKIMPAGFLPSIAPAPAVVDVRDVVEIDFQPCTACGRGGGDEWRRGRGDEGGGGGGGVGGGGGKVTSSALKVVSEVLLQLLVGEVNRRLLERVGLEDLEAEDVEHADELLVVLVVVVAPDLVDRG